MMMSKDNTGNIMGWRETYVSKDEIVDVSVVGNISTINTRNRTTGKVDSKTFCGKPLLPLYSDRATSEQWAGGQQE
jgi:hypothetical protein